VDESRDAWDEVLDVYAHHLRHERGLSQHSVRAYLTDLQALAEHARLLHVDDPADLTLRTLRSHLANQQTRGRARTTLARRATSARVFTAWLVRTGRAQQDAGALLASPRPHRPLPPTLRRDEVETMLEKVTEGLADEGPVGLRDLALLELLYATGIRVAELAGLDVDDVDRERHVVRVLGKGSKERVVPFGGPAADALDDWVRQTRETGELRLQTEQMGRSLGEWMKSLSRPLAGDRSYPVAFALAAAESGAPARQVLLAFAFGWAENMMQAAIKAVPLGQSAGQRILQRLAAEIPPAVDHALALGDHERQSFTPMLAILSARHETQYSRLFRS